MNYESHLNEDWDQIISDLGGIERLETQARETGAFLRPRGVKSAIDLLRLTLVYCLSGMSFRTTSAWAKAVGLADISDVALIKRVRNVGDWLVVLINHLLAKDINEQSKGRLIRLIDMTSVPKADMSSRKRGGQWCIHSIFELPSEQFGHFKLTDEHCGECFNSAQIIPGEIRIGDRAYCSIKQMKDFISSDADFIIRAPWRKVRWLTLSGNRLNLIKLLQKHQKKGKIDQKIRVSGKGESSFELRLIAVRKPRKTREQALIKARRASVHKGHSVQPETLIASELLILVTTLSQQEFSIQEITDLYRARWRIELAFKRLKSLIGLRRPSAVDERLAKPFILAHLLIILLIEPLIDEFEISPRQTRKQAA